MIKSSVKPLHLEIHKRKKTPKGLLRTSFRENGQVKHTTHGRITGLSYERLKLIQAALRGMVVHIDSEEAPKLRKSKDYGASFAALQRAKELELDKDIYSKPQQQWVKDCLDMIVGRLVYEVWKLSFSN